MKGMKGPQTEPGPGTSPQAARAALATVTGQGARIGIQIVGLVVLARLLSPHDYGLFAMVTAVIGVAEVFRDFGLSSAAVQAKTVSAQQRSNLFWVNTGIGLLLTGLAVACAPLVARLFGQPELTGLTMLVAVTFLMNGVATQFRADLNRHMRIGVLVVADVVSQLAGLVAGVVAATMGAGYYALAVMAIVGSGVGTAMLIVPCGWIPGRPRRGTPMKAFFTFGGGFVAAQLLSYSARSADSVVLGATLGPTPLGLYSRAYQLLTLPQQIQAPAGRIALPLLSRVQDDPVRFGHRLVKAQCILLHATALVVAVPAAVAPPLFSLVLGEQWASSAPVFRVLAVGAFASMASYACYWVFLAQGLTGSMFRFSLWARPLTIVAILLGATQGLYGVAVAYSAANLALWPATYWWLARRVELPIRALVGNGARVVLSYGSAALVAGVASMAVADRADIVQLAVGLGTWVAVMTALVALAGPLRSDIRLLAGVVMSLRRERGAPEPRSTA